MINTILCRITVEFCDAINKEVVLQSQNHLYELGCAAGPFDRLTSKRTGYAAEECREFSEQNLPPQVNVAAIRAIVSLY